MAKERCRPWLLVIAALGAVLCATPAFASAAPRRPACSIALGSPNGPPAPTSLSTSLDPGVVAGFAAFRRPAAPADQVPPLNSFGLSVGFELRSYYPGYIRRLVAPGGVHQYFVIPGFPREFSVPPARCLPKPERRRRAALVRQQQREAAQPVYCLVPAGGRGDLGGPCLPFAGIASGDGLLAGSYSGRLVADLVPDGVATVRLAYRGGRVITAPVGDNLLTFRPPAAAVQREQRVGRRLVAALNGHPSSASRKRLLARLQRLEHQAVADLTPTRVAWLDATGGVLRSFKPRGLANDFILSSSVTSTSSG